MHVGVLLYNFSCSRYVGAQSYEATVGEKCENGRVVTHPSAIQVPTSKGDVRHNDSVISVLKTTYLVLYTREICGLQLPKYTAQKVYELTMNTATPTCSCRPRVPFSIVVLLVCTAA